MNRILCVLFTGVAAFSSTAQAVSYLPPYKATDFPLNIRPRERLTSDSEAAVLGKHLYLTEYGFPVDLPNGNFSVTPRLNAGYRMCLDQQRSEVKRFIKMMQSPKKNYVRYLLKSGFGFDGEILISPEEFVAHYRGLVIRPWNEVPAAEQDATHLRNGTYPKMRGHTEILGNARLSIFTTHRAGKCYGARAEDMLFHISMLSNCITLRGANGCGSPVTSNETNVPQPHPSGMILGN